MATSRSGNYPGRSLAPGLSIGYFSVLLDSSGDPSTLTDPSGLVGVVTNVSEAAGTFTITLQDAWYQVMAIAVDNLDETVYYSQAFTAPSTLVLERTTATATIAAAASATVDVFCVCMGQ